MVIIRTKRETEARVSTKNKKKIMKTKISIMYLFLISLNIFLWLIAYIIFRDYPKLLALCLLAYGFGLRHAVDADHIAAIDNVTRKFIQEKKSPITIGFSFSLGHSSVIIIMSFLIALGTIFVKNYMEQLQHVGILIGTLVSSFFLFVIALINFIIFLDIFKIFWDIKKNSHLDQKAIEYFKNNTGILIKFFSPLFKFISKSWHMYFVGFLFGLGFDTATEIALLGISATQAAQGISIWIIMIYPFLFMAGMCLVDTSDGILMLGIYSWAFIKPLKKLFYNMTITLISFLVALFISGIEALGIISDKFELKSGVWQYINNINNNFEIFGAYIVGIFILSWIISVGIYRLSRFNRLELVINKS